MVVVVDAYSPVTSSHARRLRSSTLRDDAGPRNHVAAHSDSRSRCSGHGGRRNTPVSGDALPSLGGDAPHDKDSRASPGKGYASDAILGEGAIFPGEIADLVD